MQPVEIAKGQDRLMPARRTRVVGETGYFHLEGIISSGRGVTGVPGVPGAWGAGA